MKGTKAKLKRKDECNVYHRLQKRADNERGQRGEEEIRE